MKKILALIIALLCAPVHADTVTHCPLAADMKETSNLDKHSPQMGGLTDYNGVKVFFISSVYHSGLPVTYFKEVQLEPIGYESTLLKVKCIYVQKGGYLMEAYPVYPLVFYPPRFSTGNADGPWFNAECNSQHPEDCLITLQ